MIFPVDKKSVTALLMKFALLVLFSLCMTSCIQETDSSNARTDPDTVTTVTLTDSDALLGTWTSAYGEVYTITTTAFDSTGTSSGSTVMCYAGDNLAVCKISDTYGIMYFSYTRAYDASTNTYTTTAAQVGKWYAVAYWNLSSTSVCLSGAYKSSDGYPAADSLEAAERQFTFANGYFTGFSECVKQ